MFRKFAFVALVAVWAAPSFAGVSGVGLVKGKEPVAPARSNCPKDQVSCDKCLPPWPASGNWADCKNKDLGCCSKKADGSADWGKRHAGM